MQLVTDPADILPGLGARAAAFGAVRWVLSSVKGDSNYAEEVAPPRFERVYVRALGRAEEMWGEFAPAAMQSEKRVVMCQVAHYRAGGRPWYVVACFDAFGVEVKAWELRQMPKLGARGWAPGKGADGPHYFGCAE